MKRLIIILLCLVSIFAKAQTIQYLGSPTTQIYVRGQLRIDTVFYLPLRDTTFTPSQVGAFIVKGTVPYLWTGLRWLQMATGSPVWGTLSGTLSDQTDLQNALNAKQNTLTPGYGIKIATNTILFDSATVRKVDTITRLNDSTLNFTINGVSHSVLLRGTAAGGITSLVLNVPGTPFIDSVIFTNAGGHWSGNLILASQSANTVWSGPAVGSPAQPGFRALTTADLPTGIPNANLANSTITYAPSISGSDISISPLTVALGGTVTVAIPSAGPGARGALTAADWTSFNNKPISVNGQTGVVITKNADSIKSYPVDTSNNRNNYLVTFDSANHKFKLTAGASAGVSSVALTAPSFLSVAGSPITSSGTIALSLANQTQNKVFASPDGSTGSPAFRAILNADLPISGVTAGTYNSVTLNAQGIATAASNVGTGITSLNGLTGATQTFATGTSGSDFNISSSGTVHTYNLPTADATHRGALSTSDWSSFTAKQAQLNGTGYIKQSTTTSSFLTPTQVTADLNPFTTSLQGLVPASGGGTVTFLRADGTWAAPGGGFDSLTAQGGIFHTGVFNDTRYPKRSDSGVSFATPTQVNATYPAQQPVGDIYNRSSWYNSLTEFGIPGANSSISIVSGYPVITSTAASWSNIISQLPDRPTLLSNLSDTMEFQLTFTPGAGTTGFGPAIVTNGGVTDNSIKIYLNTSNSSNGTLIIGNTVGTTLGSGSGCTNTLNDQIRFITTLVDSTLTVTAKNLTTGTSATASVTFNTNITAPFIPNISNFAYIVHGTGTYRLLRRHIVSLATRYPYLLAAFDSKGALGAASHATNLQHQLNTAFPTTGFYSGGGQTPTDFLKAKQEVLMLNQTAILYGYGSNYKRAGQTITQATNDIITAAGWYKGTPTKFYFTIFPEDSTIAGANSAITSLKNWAVTYAASGVNPNFVYIDSWTTLTGGSGNIISSSFRSTDGIHLNQTGINTIMPVLISGMVSPNPVRKASPRTYAPYMSGVGDSAALAFNVITRKNYGWKTDSSGNVVPSAFQDQGATVGVNAFGDLVPQANADITLTGNVGITGPRAGLLLGDRTAAPGTAAPYNWFSTGNKYYNFSANFGGGKAGVTGDSLLRIIVGHTKIGASSLIFPSAFLEFYKSDGTAGNAPMKIQPGVLTTTPEIGAIESDSAISNHLWWTSKGGTRYQIDQQTGTSPPFSDATAISKNSSDATKLLKFDVSGFTTATTRTWIWPNASGTVTGIATTQTLTNKTYQEPALQGHITTSLTTGNNTIAAGAGAGTGASVSLTGTDIAGLISVTTGTLPSTASAIASMTYSQGYTSKPFVILSAANAAAAALNGVNQAYVDDASSSTSQFTIEAGTTALAPATIYKWYYIVIN